MGFSIKKYYSIKNNVITYTGVSSGLKYTREMNDDAVAIYKMILKQRSKIAKGILIHTLNRYIIYNEPILIKPPNKRIRKINTKLPIRPCLTKNQNKILKRRIEVAKMYLTGVKVCEIALELNIKHCVVVCDLTRILDFDKKDLKNFGIDLEILSNMRESVKRG